MAFKKGNKINNGKQNRLGTKNKSTIITEMIKRNFLEINKPREDDYLESLWKKSKDDWFDAYTKLLEFYKPKLARTELTGKQDFNIIWNESVSEK